MVVIDRWSPSTRVGTQKSHNVKANGMKTHGVKLRDFTLVFGIIAQKWHTEMSTLIAR